MSQYFYTYPNANLKVSNNINKLTYTTFKNNVPYAISVKDSCNDQWILFNNTYELDEYLAINIIF